MAHTKAGGSTKLGRDSASKRLGVKRFGDQLVKSGEILVRQRGTRMASGLGTGLGVDHSIYARISGRVKFTQRQTTKFSGRKVRQTIVSVE